MEFRVLGPLEVMDEGRPVSLGGTKQRSVLAMLLLDANHVVSVDRVVERLWGEHAPERPTNTLQVYISNLRRLLEGDARAADCQMLMSRKPGYVLQVSADQLDLLRFQDLVVDARRHLALGATSVAGAQLGEALSLWRGPALDDLAFEPFAREECERLDGLRVAAVEDRVDVDLALGLHRALVGELEGLVVEHPLRERLRGQYMTALYRTGRQADALKAYRDAREALVEELGIDPCPALQRLEQAILMQDPSLDISDTGRVGVVGHEEGEPIPPPPSPALVDLPVPRSSFVGRTHDLAEVARLVTDAGLVTLTGMGGTGKTRLAVHVGWEVAPQFPDGVALVELASVTDPGLIAGACASALGLKELESPLAALQDHLRQRRLLLVLDNCEHLVAGCASLVESLRRVAPGLRILATSQEVLGIEGEVAWPVRPLSLPEPTARSEAIGLDDLRESAAVRLFVDRATSSVPSFLLSPENAPAVAEVCRRLDGIPLAIELAAARVRVLSPSQLASRLDDRFRVLAGRSRSAPLRHQTLRATIDWSYELLADEERAVLRALSVFAGDCGLDAAEVVVAASGVGDDVLDVLHRLVDKSLVVMDAGREARYRLLDTVKQYASEKLATSDDARSVQERHHRWFLEMAERAADELQGPDRDLWLQRLKQDHDNLRSVLQWSLDHDEAEVCFRMAEALSCFWLRTGHLSEGRSWLERALTAGSGSHSPWRARALSGAAGLAFEQGDYEDAAELGEQARMHFEEAGDRCRLAHVLCLLGRVALAQGDRKRAGGLAADGLAVFNDLGDRAGVAAASRDLGVVARADGDHVRARSLMEESLMMFEELRRPPLVAAGGPRTASVPVAQARDRSLVLSELALVAGLEGDYPRAASLLEESLGLSAGSGSKVGTAACLEGLAGVAAHQDEPERAATLLGAAEALRHAMGAVLPPFERLERERLLTEVDEELGAQASADARLRGWAMGETEAVVFACRQSEQRI